jgi:hypothetical protein
MGRICTQNGVSSVVFTHSRQSGCRHALGAWSLPRNAKDDTQTHLYMRRSRASVASSCVLAATSSYTLTVRSATRRQL